MASILPPDVKPIEIQNDKLREAYLNRIKVRKALGQELIAQGVGLASGILEYVLLTYMNGAFDSFQIKLALRLDGTVEESYHNA